MNTEPGNIREVRLTVADPEPKTRPHTFDPPSSFFNTNQFNQRLWVITKIGSTCDPGNIVYRNSSTDFAMSLFHPAPFFDHSCIIMFHLPNHLFSMFFCPRKVSSCCFSLVRSCPFCTMTRERRKGGAGRGCWPSVTLVCRSAFGGQLAALHTRTRAG